MTGLRYAHKIQAMTNSLFNNKFMLNNKDNNNKIKVSSTPKKLDKILFSFISTQVIFSNGNKKN